VSQGELGRSVFTPEGRRGRDRQPRGKRRAAMAGVLCAWRPRLGHAPPIEALYRARGERDPACLGSRFWASSVGNLMVGL